MNAGASLGDQAARLSHRNNDKHSGGESAAYLQSNAFHAFFSPGPSKRANIFIAQQTLSLPNLDA
jgi:hypothetical protein